MVRRWSSINTNNYDTENFFAVTKRFKFLNFRSAVYLRRFNTSITRFKRKTISKWKRRSTRFIYLNLFKHWALDYRFNKNYYKFQFLENFLNFSFFFFDASFFKRNKDFSDLSSNFLSASILKKNFYYINNFKFFKPIIFKNLNIKYGFSLDPNPKLPDNKIFISHASNSDLINFEKTPEMGLVLNFKFYTYKFYLIEYYKILKNLFYFKVK